MNLINYVIFSKFHFTQIKNKIEELKLTNITEYKDLKLIDDYMRLKHTGKFVYCFFIFLEILKVLHSVAPHRRFMVLNVMLFSFTRILIINKLYYLYFIFKFH